MQYVIVGVKTSELHHQNTSTPCQSCIKNDFCDCLYIKYVFVFIKVMALKKKHVMLLDSRWIRFMFYIVLCLITCLFQLERHKEGKLMKDTSKRIKWSLISSCTSDNGEKRLSGLQRLLKCRLSDYLRVEYRISNWTWTQQSFACGIMALDRPTGSTELNFHVSSSMDLRM